MLPTEAFNNPENCHVADAKLYGKSSAAVCAASVFVAPSNFGNGFFRQLGITLFFAFYLSALTVTVCCIVGTGAKEEMLRIDAIRIVTLMADQKAIGYFAKVKHPGISVSFNGLPIDTDDAVTVSKCACHPRPALATDGMKRAIFADTFPESCFWTNVGKFNSSAPLPSAVVSPAIATSNQWSMATWDRTREKDFRTAGHDSTPLVDLRSICGRWVRFPLFGDQPSRHVIIWRTSKENRYCG